MAGKEVSNALSSISWSGAVRDYEGCRIVGDRQSTGHDAGELRAEEHMKRVVVYPGAVVDDMFSYLWKRVLCARI